MSTYQNRNSENHIVDIHKDTIMNGETDGRVPLRKKCLYQYIENFTTKKLKIFR